jgi:hypothetical protein
MNTAEYSREDIITSNPLLDYAERQGWKLKRVGANFVCLCPLHGETTPSFTFNPGKNLWRCFGCGAGGSVIDLHADLRGLSIGAAMRELSPAADANCSSSNREKHRARQAPTEAEERARLRADWPAFDQPVEGEIKAIAELRGLSPEGVALASERGLLYSAESREGRCWVVTDSRRLNAQARRMDGKPWGIGGRTRVIYTQRSAGWDAKIRINLPEKLPCQFDALLPLLGQQQEEVRNEAPAASASTSEAQDTAPSPPINADLHDQLLTAIGDMENELVCGYLIAHKRIPSGGSIEDLSENQARWIVDHAAEFRARVEKFADQPF